MSSDCPHVICTCLQQELDSAREELAEAVYLLVSLAQEEAAHDGADPDQPSTMYDGRPQWYEYLTPHAREFLERHPESFGD